MVAVARIMNATLVIPQLDKRSFWQDSRCFHMFLVCWMIFGATFCNNFCCLNMVPKCSVFADIFDVDHFITTLQDDVKIVKELPRRLITIPRARKHFTSWAGVGYYEDMTHLFKNHQVNEMIHLFSTDP